VNSDRNLLFGILALQVDFISRDTLVAGMLAWVLNKAKPLGQVLQEQGVLPAESRSVLEALVARHLELHDGDAQKSLAAVAAPEPVRAELSRIVDHDLHASLTQLPTTPSEPNDLNSTSASVSDDGARFQVLRPHARGGLGEVFVARDAELNREVALKEMHARHADHPERRARFVREAEITGNLEHPGIVPVYALGHHPDGRPYYAMRFIKGMSLKEAIDRFHSPQAQGLQSLGFHSLAFRQLLNRFVTVCNAIAYAHSRGVLHRDLKPSNIMFGDYGETLVVDWGLAKSGVSGPADELPGNPERTSEPMLLPSDSDSDLTRVGQALGTPAYMSPEQAAGRLDLMGPASDVYSLGATLYSLLTDKVPFENEDVGALLNLVQRGDFPPPRRVNRQVPSALEAICRKAMALQPQDRYPSAKALADDLEHWLADEAVSAHAEPWHGRLGRWVRHHRGLVGSATAVLVVTLTVAIATWLLKEAADRQRQEQELRGEAEEQRKRADHYLYFSRVNLAHRAWQEAQIARMDELLEQTLPEHTGGQDFRNWEWHYLRRLRQRNLLDLSGHSAQVQSVAFSPDGQRVASAGVDRTIKIWNTRTGQETLAIEAHAGPITSVAYSPDGQRLASASGDGSLRIWNALTGQEDVVIEGHADSVQSVAFSPDGRQLASAGFDTTVKIWDARTGQERHALRGHTSSVQSLAFSPDGRRLASGGIDRTVRIWDVRTGKESLALSGIAGEIRSVAFSPDSRRVACASYDRMTRIWDADTGQPWLFIAGHASFLNSVAFSPDGQRLASAGDDRTVKVWNARTGLEYFTLRGHAGSVSSVAFSPDGQWIASGSHDKTVKLWDARSDQESLVLRGHENSVTCVAFSPDGRRLASASFDRTARVWDRRTGQELLAFGHGIQVHAVAFSPDGQRIASIGYDRTAKVWDSRTGQVGLTLEGHSGQVSCVAFSPDGRQLATEGGDRTVKVWDARTGQVSLTIKGHTAPVSTVAFSPDGQRLASAGQDRTLRVWDARTGKEQFTINAHAGTVSRAVFSADGQRLASSSGDHTVKVWDANTGQEVLALKGHTGAVFAVAFSPDGKRLASASADQTMRLWDAHTGQESLELKGHAGGVWAVAFSPDGQQLASAGIDMTVRVWDATPLSDESSQEARAFCRFRFAAETIVLRDEVLRGLRSDATLDEPVRRRALRLTAHYRESPARLNDASWPVARRAWARPGGHALALRQAEAACRQQPGNGGLLNTLGAAQYRNGQYAAALKTLTESEKLNAASGGRARPEDLAFLAMTQYELGKKAEAAATLGRLHEALKSLPFDREVEELLREAEGLMGGERRATGRP
jgi:WD40 repeat protein/serine/threonine protein kinase